MYTVHTFQYTQTIAIQCFFLAQFIELLLFISIPSRNSRANENNFTLRSEE